MPASPRALDELEQSIIHGDDGRAEYYEIADDVIRERLAASAVALIPNRYLDRRAGRITSDAPTTGELVTSCPGERFADQPGVAFCSGTLVDWDLVLTSGHCLRLFGLESFSVVFGYFYERAGELALGSEDIAFPVEIVAEALDAEGEEPRLDYAWLRLSRRVGGSRAPAPIHRLDPEIELGDPVVTMGTPNGAPLKVDATGTVRGLREARDYFVANTDTSAGWSGGGAYAERLALLGVLSRGGLDRYDTASGCSAPVEAPEEGPAEEAFTYAFRALEALCTAAPERSLCRIDCDEPCLAEPRAVHDRARDGGCSLAPSAQSGLPERASIVVLALLGFWYSRRCTRSTCRLP